MQEYKIYLFAGQHPVYETLVKFPPRGVIFKSPISLDAYNKVSIYTDKRYKFIKKIVGTFIRWFGLPRLIYFKDIGDCELIHSCRSFIPLNNRPWIVDFEHSSVFGNLKNPIIRFMVRRFFKSKNCKKILAHCKAAELSLRNALDCSDFSDKIDTLHFAVETPKLPPKKDTGKIRILHISARGDFYRKGVRELLLAAEIITKKYPQSEFWIRATIPDEWKERVKNNQQIKFIEGIIPKNKLFEDFYFKGDIFCSTSYSESFGYPFLEAMSAGLPVVGNNLFAIPEFIENNKNGYLIDSPIGLFDKKTYQYSSPELTDEIIVSANLSVVVNQLVDKLSILIENKNLRQKMGRESRKIVDKNFSIKQRNDKLLGFYKEALSK